MKCYAEFEYHFCFTMNITTPTSSAGEEKKLGSNTEYLKSKALLYFKLGNKSLGEWYLSHAIDMAKQEKITISCAEVAAIVEGKALAENTPSKNSQAPILEPETSAVLQESQDIGSQIQALLEPLAAAMAEIKAMFKKIRELLPSLQLEGTTKA